MNVMISSNAKALRNSQLNTAKAIAKISSIRGHAEGFAENMVHNKAADGEAPNLVTTWSAFSGLLDPQTIDDADWGDRTKRPASKHSKSARRHNRVLRPRVAEPPGSDAARGVPAHRRQGPRSTDAERLRAPQPRRAATRSVGHGLGQAQARRRRRRFLGVRRGRGRERRRLGLGLGTGLRSSFLASCGRSSPPPMCLQPPRCTPHCLAHPKRFEWLACAGRVSVAVSNGLSSRLQYAFPHPKSPSFSLFLCAQNRENPPR